MIVTLDEQYRQMLVEIVGLPKHLQDRIQHSDARRWQLEVTDDEANRLAFAFLWTNVFNRPSATHVLFLLARPMEGS